MRNVVAGTAIATLMFATSGRVSKSDHDTKVAESKTRSERDAEAETRSSVAAGKEADEKEPKAIADKVEGLEQDFAAAKEVPSKIPRRRSTQLLDGFGVNLNLPRRPRMPWTKTWTPLFDSGVKWVRIGQYENSSEKISWDWVEQTPGHYAVPRDADEAVRSLLDNGVCVEAELQYSNPLYAEDRSKRPVRVTLPPPGIGQNDDPPNPIFLAPKSDEQIAAFLGYVRFMVGRYKGRINRWELWNEENIGYWRPDIGKTEKGKWYGRVLCRFADAVHATDPDAKVMFGGLAGPDLEFAVNALAGCPG